MRHFVPAIPACSSISSNSARAGRRSRPAYLALLGNSAVVDYDTGNVSAYTAHLDDVPLISFAHAPYLAGESLPIDARPIDILFFGSVNERREQLIKQVESSGRTVTLLSSPLYGPERDELIKQAKAVFNCHFYESARFEQARAFQCMSLGTPVISERTVSTLPPVQFEDTVFWVDSNQLGSFFAERFGSSEFADDARSKLSAFQRPRRDRAVRRRAGLRLRIPQGAGAAHAPGSLAAHAAAHRFGQGLPVRLVQRGRARTCAARRGARPGPAPGLAAGRGQRFARPGGVAARQPEHDLLPTTYWSMCPTSPS